VVHRATAWLLERTNKKFAPRRQVDISGEIEHKESTQPKIHFVLPQKKKSNAEEISYKEVK
jgi:hypothetical protein